MEGVKIMNLPWRHIFIDTVLTLGIPNGLLYWSDYHGTVFSQAGFFCNDNSIRLPYKRETIPMWVLTLYENFIPAVVILLVETYCMLTDKTEICSAYEKNRPFPQRLIIRVVHFFRCHLLAMGLHYAIFMLSRHTIGRMRPNYLDRCRPNIGYKVCNTTEYITNYVCTGPLTFEQLEGTRTSFFSGHASISAVVSTFLTLYFHLRLGPKSNCFTLVPWLQLAINVLSIFIGYSRVVDNYHHGSDVLIGFLVGCFTTLLTWKYIAKFDKEQRKFD